MKVTVILQKARTFERFEKVYNTPDVTKAFIQAERDYPDDTLIGSKEVIG